MTKDLQQIKEDKKTIFKKNDYTSFMLGVFVLGGLLAICTIILPLEEILKSVLISSVILYFFCYISKTFWCNQKIRNKYRRENIEENPNFEIKRCKKEDEKGDSGRVYIVDNKRGTYHHIIDHYTLCELGLGSQDVSNDFFLKKNTI